MPADGRTLMRWPGWWPAPDIAATFDRLNRELFDLTRSLRLPRPAEIEEEEAWMPPADIHEGEDAITIALAVPGVAREDLSVDVNEDAVEVKGEKQAERDIRDKGYRLQELSYGSFYRRIPLPVPVEAAKAEAALKDGILSIRIPRRMEARPKAVKVTVA